MVTLYAKCNRIFASLFCVLMLLSAFAPSQAAYENTYRNTGNQSVDITSVALTQMGYIDSANGVQDYSKYGSWYGIPNGYWCAMFVSWCADQADISSRILPRFSSCTAGMRTFQSMGRWQNGPHWGGTYTPKTGDLIFYNWSGDNASDHVGIVLYCEDGWLYSVEGNTLANRLDETEAYHPDTPPTAPYVPDIVMVRAHRLNSIYIRGYAVPNYAGTDTSPLSLQGYVDIPRGTSMAAEIQRVLSAGLMAPMSSHTFGPMYGITRGEYVAALAKYLGLETYASDTVPFHDLPSTHPAYDAVMAFRSAGILQGSGSNYVYPDKYITVAEADAILDRVYTLLGKAAPEVSYVGRAKEGYLQRYEVAHALCVLLARGGSPVSASTQVLLDGVSAGLNTLQFSGVNYVTVGGWQQLLSMVPAEESPSLEDSLLEEDGAQPESPSETPTESAEITEMPVEPSETPETPTNTPAEPSESPEPPTETTLTLSLDRDALAACASFSWNGTQWYTLRDLADCSGLSVLWDSATGITQFTPDLTR